MITNNNLVFRVTKKVTKSKMLELITQKLVDEGFATSLKPVLEGFKAREKESSTGLGEGIAIPHVFSSAIKEAKIVVARVSKENAIDWKALDGQPTDFIIAIAVPESGRNEHFELLTALSTKLANPEFVKEFKKAKKDVIFNEINNLKEDKTTKKIKAKKGAIKVVGVTTCVTGVAHTFIAAQTLEDEGARRGWDVKIERQGQMTKNHLTQKEIDEADYVIFGISKQIDGGERFNGKKTYTVEVAKLINEAKECMDEMLEKATIQKGSGGSTSKSTGNMEEQKASFMSHMMAGISYMIPYIAMAGIVLGLTTAFGYKVFDKTSPNYQGATGFQPISPFANALKTLADGGFTLYIPILSMFIANSIAGRKAMAPAAILAFVLNTAPDISWVENGSTVTPAIGFSPFFNWKTLGFYGWEHSPALGFLGSVAAGYMVGFGIKFFTKYTDKVENLAFQAIVPLLILPIMFTLLPWLFMAFIGYLPLYGISIGLNWIVLHLIKINMFWLAGGIMGAMICFDLGGPVNKIAMVIGSMMLAAGTADMQAANAPELASVNGVCALAVSIPPTVLFFSNIGHRFTPLKMNESDQTAAWTASLMGFFGITEGSIPFAAKDPKKWMPAFMAAGFVGGAIMGLFTQFGFGIIDNVPMWGGPIILIAGGYGTTALESSQAFSANWTWTLLYFIPLVVSGLLGFLTAAGLEWFYEKNSKKE